jgi:hypothetical protein
MDMTRAHSGSFPASYIRWFVPSPINVMTILFFVFVAVMSWNVVPLVALAGWIVLLFAVLPLSSAYRDAVLRRIVCAGVQRKRMAIQPYYDAVPGAQRRRCLAIEELVGSAQRPWRGTDGDPAWENAAIAEQFVWTGLRLVRSLVAAVLYGGYLAMRTRERITRDLRQPDARSGRTAEAVRLRLERRNWITEYRLAAWDRGRALSCAIDTRIAELERKVRELGASIGAPHRGHAVADRLDDLWHTLDAVETDVDVLARSVEAVFDRRLRRSERVPRLA